MPDTANTPRPPLSVADPTARQTALDADLYVRGNPAVHRLPMEPRAYFPELTTGNWFAADGAVRLYQLYAEMVEKDGSLSGVLEQRRSAVLARERIVLPASPDPRDTEVARFVEAALDHVGGADGGFDADLSNLLHGIQTGLSIVEVVWEAVESIHIQDPDGGTGGSNGPKRLAGRYVLPRDLRHRFTPRFVFRKDGTLCFAPRSFEEQQKPVPVPERKFLQLRFGGDYENPYGRGLLQHVWWYYRFKIAAMRAWQIHNDKYGSPTVKAQEPAAGVSDETRAAMLDVLQRIATDTGVVIPYGFEVELLEAARGSGDPFQMLLDYCDDCIARAIVGSTLTASEGQRSGSLALGKVHADVAADKIEQDARMLMWVVNRQLIRWIVDFNFGIDVPAPAWVIDTSGDEDLEKTAEWLKILFDMGLQIPASFVAERFGIPAPADGEPYLGLDMLRDIQQAITPQQASAPKEGADDDDAVDEPGQDEVLATESLGRRFLSLFSVKKKPVIRKHSRRRYSKRR